MATKKRSIPLADTGIDWAKPAGEFTPNARPEAPAADAPQQDGMMRRYVGDTAASLGRGAVMGVRLLADTAGADNRVSTGLRSVEDFIGGLQSASAKADQQEMARILKEAEGKGVLDQVVAGAKAFGVAPLQTMAQAAGTSLPTIGAALIPGVGPAAMAARFGAPLALGAAQGTGAVKASIYDAVKQRAVEEGRTPAEAEQLAVQAQEYGGANTGQIALGAGLGAWAGKSGLEGAAQRLMYGTGGKATGGMASRVAMGAVAEGIPEALQGGQEKYAGNVAQANVGFPTDPMSGVVANATMEGLAGHAMGGAMGIPNPNQPPVVDPGSAIRATKQPEGGPMTRAANAAIEAQAQAAETGLPGLPTMTAEQEQAALAAIEAQGGKDAKGLRQFAATAGRAAGVQPKTDPFAGTTAPDEPSATVGDMPFSDRVLTLQEQLSDQATRQALRDEFGEDALSQATYYASIADRPDIKLPNRTQDNMLALAERMVSMALLKKIDRPGLDGTGPAPDQLAGPEGADPLQIGLDTVPTGTIRVDGGGNAAPETRADAINTRQAAGAVRDEKGTPRGASTMAPEPPQALTYDTGPTGRMRAGPQGVAPETNAQAINTRQAQAERDAEAQRQADMGMTPDVRAVQERNALGRAMPGDIQNPKGKPFTHKRAAETAQKKAKGGTVLQVADGWVVRPEPNSATVALFTENQEPADAQAALVPPADTPAAEQEGADRAGTGTAEAPASGGAGAAPGAGPAVEAPGLKEPATKKPPFVSKQDAEQLFGVPQKRAKALDRIARGAAYFGTKDKANEFIVSSGLKDTHEVVEAKPGRHEARAKAAGQGKEVMPAGLTVTFGGKTYPVESVEDAQRKWIKFQETADGGAAAGVSQVGNGVPVNDGAGRLVARVAFNGRAFDAADNLIAEAPKVLAAPEPAIDRRKRLQTERAAPAMQPEPEVAPLPDARQQAGKRWSAMTSDQRAEVLGKAGMRDVAPASPWANIGNDKQDALAKAMEPTTTPERRTDAARRKMVDEMTPEEMRVALLVDDLTGLNNGRWLRENQPSYSHIIAFDADSLKWVNDNMGHDAGDMLLKAWGAALQQATPNAARAGGDEFFALANSQAEAQAIAARVEKALSEAIITAATPDGDVTIRGIGASFGIAQDRKAADEALNQHKRTREAAGTRAGRGEQPPGTTRSPAAGQQDQVNQGGRQDDPAGQAEEVKAAPAPAAPSANTIFTEDAAAAARARLKAKLGRLNSGLDPETMMDGITLAGYHIEKGARRFAAFARAMVDDLGDGVKPYLQSWYMATRADPRAAGFRADMDKASAVEDLDVDEVLASTAPMAEPAGDTMTAEQAEAEVQRMLLDDAKLRPFLTQARNDVGAVSWTAKPFMEQALVSLLTSGKVTGKAYDAVAGKIKDDTQRDAWTATLRSLARDEGATTGPDAPAAPTKDDTQGQEATNDSTPSGDAPAVDKPLAAGQRPVSDQATRGTRQPRRKPGRTNDRSVRDAGGLFEGLDDEGGDVGDGGGAAGVPDGPADAVAGGDGRVSAPDYRPGIGGLKREGSWHATAKRNLDLIDLARQIESEKRDATPDEQALLSKYVGFGASEMRNAMFPVPSEWQRKAAPPGALIFPAAVYEARWRPLAERAAALPLEWQRTILQSTQYAHYTSEGIIRSVWSAVQRLGFTGGKVFEPGGGIGSFAMLMPDAIHKTSKFTGIEFDGPTALIARLLSPSQNMLHDDFIKRRLPDNFFDVAVGNPPFAPTAITADPRYQKQGFLLHDYFFAKALDKVRPGGLLAFVTSKGTMDKKTDKARRYLMERADLVGAIRLPSTAFEDNAGTSVVTDVIFLRKRMAGEAPGGQPWADVATVETKDGPVVVNQYFAANPEMVLGQQRISGNTDDQGRRINSNGRGGEKYTVVSYDTTTEELDAKFAAAVERLPQNVYSALAQEPGALRAEVAKMDFDPKVKREGVVYLGKGGALLRVEDGIGKPLADAVKLSPKDVAWMTDYVGVRDLVKEAQLAQVTDGAWEAALKKLNKAYDAFVKKNGPINAFRVQVRKSTDEEGNEVETPTRVFTNRRLIREDYDSALMTQMEAIDEDGQIKKAPFLLGRTIGKPVSREVKSIGDALAVSLDAIGSLGLADVAARLKITRDEAIDALGSQIYKEPGGDWMLADEYLSGNVVDKLAEAMDAASLDRSLERNVEALKAVQPEKLGPSQISVKLGAPWVDAKHVNDFATSIEAGKVTFDPKTETWQVDGGNMRSERRAGAEFGTAARSPSELLEAILNSRTIKVMMTVANDSGKGTKQVVDTAGSTAANEMAKKIKEKFKTWVWTDSERAADLVEGYNARYNNLAPRVFDGSHLSLPGVSLRYKLHPHQLRAIWRQIQTGSTYLAHAVGAGKTIEMIAGGMEQKRLGLIRKPVYVVPNHMLEQFSNEFMELYPLANIMVADDQNFSKERRKAFVAAATLNSPDAIVITHDAFQRIGVKPETINPIRDEILADLEEELSAVAKDAGARVRRGQLEQQIEAVNQRFDSILAAGKKDGVVDFEDMGVDFIYADEAHVYRKLDFHTAQSIKGIDPNGSRRALDMYVKTRHLDRMKPGRAMVFASGTAVTNTMGEIFTIMRFFDPKTLDEGGISTFDSWARMFGEVASALEPNAAGKYEIVERFAKFDNVPELMSRVRKFMDVLQSDQLGAIVKRPETRGGKPNLNLVEPSQAMKDYQANVLQPRLDASRAWKPTFAQPNNPDPVIAIISDGRLAASDPRFIPGARLLPGETTKIDEAAKKIAAEYIATADNEYVERDGKTPMKTKGGTQIVFYNVGFGAASSARRGFDSRGTFTKAIVAGGVKREHIVWFDDADTDAKKEAVFKGMRNGTYRVLIGSAKKMGTGVNVQNRLTTLHYMDPPWFPADVEQPRGRIIRQGNQNPIAGEEWYATKGGYDSTMWQMVGRKQRFIDQAFRGDKNLRSMEDLGEASLYEQAAAMASGDPRALVLAGLRQDTERLERQQAAHASEQVNARQAMRQAEWAIESAQQREATYAEAFKAIGGTYFQFSAGVVKGTTFTKQTEFGQALKDAFNKGAAAAVLEPGRVKQGLGTIGDGLALTMHAGFHYVAEGKGKDVTHVKVPSGRHQLTVTAGGHTMDVGDEVAGMGADVDALGLARKIVNTLNGVEASLRNARAAIASNNIDIVRLRKKIGAPFEHQQEMLEKWAALKELEEELRLEGLAQPAGAAADKSTNLAQTGDPVANTTDVVYSRTQAQPQPATGRRKAVEALVQQIAARWANAPEVVVVDSLADPRVPEAVRKDDQTQQSQGAAGAPEGFFHGGKVYLVASQLRGDADVVRVLFHESLGHYGLRGTFGPALGTILDRVAILQASKVRAKAKQYGLDYDKPSDRRAAAEEALAEMAQTTPNLGWGQKAIAAVRTWLRQHVPGFRQMALSDAEIVRSYILPARAFVQRGGPAGGPGGGVRFSRGTTRSMPEPKAPGRSGDAQGADSGKTITEANEESSPPADGFTRLYHAGSDPVGGGYFSNVPSGRVFDGMFALRDGWGNYGTGAKYFADIADEKVLSDYALNYEIDSEVVGAALRKAMPWLDDSDFDTAWRAVVEDRSDRLDEDDLTRIFREDSAGEASWEAQRIRGQVAKTLGYQAVEMSDENGTALLIVSGTPLTRVVPNDQTAPASGGAMFSRASLADAVRNFNQADARNAFLDAVTTHGGTNFWGRTVGTQYHKAKTHPGTFGRVFDAVQDYIKDTSVFANRAADNAPSLLPKLDSWTDLKKGGLRYHGAKPADTAKAGEAIFRGTLDKVLYDDETLASRFGLNELQRGLYREFRRAVDESLEGMAKTEILRLAGDDGRAVRTAVLDAPDAETAAEVLSAHLTELAELTANDDLLGTVAMIGEKVKRVQQLQDEGYAPLMRFGKHTLHVQRPDGSTEFFGMYEGVREANTAARLLRGDPALAGMTFTQGVMSEQGHKLFNGMSLDALELFADSIGQQDNPVYQEYLKLALSNRSAMKRMIERKAIKGYSDDVARVLASFVTSNARMSAGNLHLTDAKKMAEAIPKEAGDLRDDAINLVDYVTNPIEEAAGMRNLLFINFIGGSVASALVNMTQPLTMTLPYLTQWGGVAKASKRLAAAVAMVASGKGMDAGLKAALARAEQDGIVSPQEIHHLQAEAMNTLGKHPMLKKAAFVWGAMFSLAEQFNRRVSFVAAYQTAQAEGIANPFEFAEETVVETQGLYNKGNKANWARGAIGATAMTFKQFSTHYLEWLVRMAKSGPEGRKAVAVALALLLLTAGAGGLPFADDLDDLIDTLGQFMGHDTNSKRWKREFVAQTLGLGDTAAEVATRGLSALPGMPMDVSLRMGMGNLLPATGLFLRSNTDTGRQLLEIAGAAGGLATNVMDGVKKAAGGDVVGGVMNAMPVAVQNMAKAAQMMDTGEFRNKKGALVMETDAVDAAMKFISFQPASVARESNRVSEILRTVQLAKNVESEIAGRWAQGMADGDQEAVKAARQELADWNKANPQAPIRITMPQVIQRLKALRATRAERTLKQTPRELRPLAAETFK